MNARDMDKPLTKVETVALWHAVGWMETCIEAERKDRPDAAYLPNEMKRLKDAKRALRKVNDLRRQGL